MKISNINTKNSFAPRSVDVIKSSAFKENAVLSNDIFLNSTSKINSFKGGLFSSFKNFIVGKNCSDLKNNIPSDKPFSNELADDFEKINGYRIPAENFNNIISPDEFKELLPSLNQENFISSHKNLENGTYFIDLDYQSTYSSGTQNIFNILDDIEIFTNDFYERTGKDFIFALSDKDSLEGSQNIIRIIAENPDKYKHLKFVPAINLSFAHKAPTSNIGYENSNMLVYGLNPFSEKIINYVDTTTKNRKEMVINFIKKVKTLYPEFAYNIIEFAEQNSLKYSKSYAISNLYWRAREYAETKGDTAIKSISFLPKDILIQAENIINELGQVETASQNSGYSALGTQIINDSDEVNKTIKTIFDEYSTHYDKNSGKVVSVAENLYEDMIKVLSSGKSKPVLAISNPFYFSHYFEERDTKTFKNVVDFFNVLKKNSNGMLCAFESVCPLYNIDSNLDSTTINNFNSYIRDNTNLYEVGGSFASIDKER